MSYSVLTILLPTAFFAALDRGVMTISATGVREYAGTLITDQTRDQILRMSRGLAVLLLIVYVPIALQRFSGSLLLDTLVPASSYTTRLATTTL